MTLEHKHCILLVDDEVSITKALQRLFRKEGHQIITATSGQEGLDLLKDIEKPISLIVSDQRMPEMTGSEFLEKAKYIFPDAIRFLLTGYSDMGAIVDAVNKGEIHRYLTKPWNDDDLLLQVRQSLEQYELVFENRRLLDITNRQNRELNELNRDLEKKVKERTHEILIKSEELEEVNRKLENSFIDTIRLLSSLIETLNPGLGSYMKEVAELARGVAGEYAFDKNEIGEIEMAAMIHDIGLLGIPESILRKDESSMSETEFRMFSQHPVIASISLESIDRLAGVGEIILYHHEYYDGSGFPNGLKGEEIPLGSRIIRAAADYFKILNTWPKKKNQIIEKAREYFGSATTNNFASIETEKLLEQVALKIILLGANEKYDVEVVTKLTKKVQESRSIKDAEKQKIGQTFFIDLEGLKEGMVLVDDLRLTDGRLLLVKGTRLKDSLITAIKSIGGRQAVDNEIHVSI